MGQYAFDTLTRVDWVVTLSSTTAPTAAQLNAGTNLSTLVTKDGVNVSLSNNKVSTATIATITDTEVPGSTGASVTLTGLRDDSADTFWNLAVYNTAGFVVIRRGILYSTSYSAAQKVEVYPAKMFNPIPAPSAANTSQTFTVEFAVTGEIQLKATVA
jgi:hypothetical protein